MERLPLDSNSRKIASRARQLVHGAFDAEKWEFHEQTGVDRGIDCSFELIEENEYHNHRIDCQIKGTRSPKEISGDCFSFPLDVKTINYGLSSGTAFVLLYVDVANAIVYYLPIQDYFIADPSLFDKIGRNTTTLNIHIPKNNVVTIGDVDLQEIAKSIYVEGPGRRLHKYVPEEN